jgi:hypothetical protein
MAVGGWAMAKGGSATVQAPVAVTLIRPISLKKCQDLWFGNLLIEANSGALQIHQTAGDGGGVRKPDPPGVTQIAVASALWHNAKFEVDGQGGLGYTVTVTNHPIVIQSSTHETMTVGLNYYSSDTVIDPKGSTIWVGGKLYVPNSPRPGRYSGEFEVTVAYY